MDCLNGGELIAYHFATTSDAERDAIDAHLLVCGDCLRAYLRLKHHVERGAALADRPSAQTRQRVRDDVLAAFRPSAKDRVRAWLRRPIPLYQGLAAAAVAILAATAGPILADALSANAPKSASTERIDTSRPSPESLTFY